MFGHDEVIIAVAIHPDGVRREYIHKVFAQQVRAVLFRQVALLGLRFVVLRRLVAALLVELRDDRHKKGHIVHDRAAPRVLGVVPLPIPDVPCERDRRALKLDHELCPRVELQELAFEPVHDAVELRVALLEIVGEADQIVKRAESKRPVTVRHAELPQRLLVMAPLRAQQGARVQVRQKFILLSFATLCLGATNSHDPKLLANRGGLLGNGHLRYGPLPCKLVA
mmetsp:Transcript_6060/g.14979  ORF Transcript_6060/g.14979 Transcript_6060/m.14979 type:complete len:225 (-) Transcript_6060:30-704(-)